jgi:septal ring factor EnvC (AmiA/AmiB activator)
MIGWRVGSTGSALLCLIFLSACACNQATDPRIDQGLFSTIGGVACGYEKDAEQREAARDAENARTETLRQQEQANKEELDRSEQQIAALKADIRSADQEISRLKEKVDELRVRRPDAAERADEINGDLDAAKDRLDAAGLDPLHSEAELQERLQAAKSDIALYEAMLDQLLSGGPI